MPSWGLLAITWRDLDAEAGTIRIDRAIKWRKGSEWYLDEPKTEAARRTLRLDAAIIERLADQRRSQLEERMRVGKAWRDHGFIFADEIGEPYSQGRLRHYCKAILRAAELPETFTPYSTRHTSATWMIEQGINAKVVAARLGHSDISVTLGVYTHPTEGMDRQASEVASRLIEGRK